MFKRIAVGISGGVDSAVSAFLLKRAKFQVEGVFMRNWDNQYESGFCSDEKDFEDATFVCRKLDIPLHRVYFIKEYWNEVFTEFLRELESGLTTNPDILCNRHIKFDSFFEHCRIKLAVDAIATGHYAKTSFGPYLELYKEDHGVKLLQPLDKNVDQTFFLSQVKQFSLRKCMFPLGNLLKSQVREIAKKEGLIRVADKKTSIGICFVGKRRFQDFIQDFIQDRRGLFIDIETGKELGEHSGLHKWTIGQKCKLCISNIPYYVFKKDVETNNIYVVAENRACAVRMHPDPEQPDSLTEKLNVLDLNHRLLWSNICFTDTPHWIHRKPTALEDNDVFHCHFRFQQNNPLVPCRIVVNSDGLTILLDKYLRALTEGQYAVFYVDKECIGSAKIKRVCHNLEF